jgi:dihydroorotase
LNVLIVNGRIIDPTQDLDESADVLIEDGQIAAIGGSLTNSKNIERVDATGCVVSPGFIDLHAHLREPGQEHKETIESGTAAAVVGGYTAVCAMANTLPPNDERAVTEMILAAVSKRLKGEELAELAELRAAGCVAVSDDGKPIQNSQLMRRALEYTTMLGIPVIAHEEDPYLSQDGVMHEGFFSTLLGLTGVPAAAEEVMTARDVLLAELTRAHLHVAHVSTIGAVQAVRRAKEAGVHVTCEVTPHHLALTDESLQSFSTNRKMNPPLRSQNHREALLEAVAEGTIDVIATDHAPHHVDEKNVEFDLAPFGVIGLETAFAVAHDRLVTTRVINLPRLIEMMSCRPAKIFNLPGGTLREGAPGDVTVFDPLAILEPREFVSRASNSPFIGERFTGRVIATIVGGDVRFTLRRTAEPVARPARRRG